MEMTEEGQKIGLSYLVPQDMRAPGYQMGTLPTSVERGEHGLEVAGLRTGNLLSFGTAGGFPVNIPGFTLTQLRGPLNALGGTSFTGEPLVYPTGGP